MSNREEAAGLNSKYLAPIIWSVLEVGFTILISNLAILFGAFAYQLMQEKSLPMADVLSLQFGNIQYKDVIVFVFGIAAPSIWILGRNHRLWRHSKLCFALFVVQILVVFGGGLVYSLSLTGAVKNIAFAELWAFRCLLVAIFLWFMTLCCQKIIIERSGGGLASPGDGEESGQDVLKYLRRG